MIESSREPLNDIKPDSVIELKCRVVDLHNEMVNHPERKESLQPLIDDLKSQIEKMEKNHFEVLQE